MNHLVDCFPDKYISTYILTYYFCRHNECKIANDFKAHEFNNWVLIQSAPVTKVKHKKWNHFYLLHLPPLWQSMLLLHPVSSTSGFPWSKWPKCVSLYYWRAPRGARGVKKAGQPNWSPLWCDGVLRFSQNRRNYEKQSKLNKNWQRNLFSEGFSNFIQFELNLSAPTHQSGLQFGIPDFLTPLSLLGMSR